MKRFNLDELAKYVGIYARLHANTPVKFYQVLKTSLNTTVKQAYKHVLTEEELQSVAVQLATKCLPFFNSISDAGILRLISPQFKQRANSEGLDLKVEEKYFDTITKKMATIAKKAFLSKYQRPKKKK